MGMKIDAAGHNSPAA